VTVRWRRRQMRVRPSSFSFPFPPSHCPYMYFLSQIHFLELSSLSLSDLRHELLGCLSLCLDDASRQCQRGPLDSTWRAGAPRQHSAPLEVSTCISIDRLSSLSRGKQAGLVEPITCGRSQVEE